MDSCEKEEAYALAASLKLEGRGRSQDEACMVGAWDRGTCWEACEVASYEWEDTCKADSRREEDSRFVDSWGLDDTYLL